MLPDGEDRWHEYGVRRTWGPHAGTVAYFGRDRRAAEQCAAVWPGALVTRVVTAAAWETVPQPKENTGA